METIAPVHSPDKSMTSALNRSVLAHVIAQQLFSAYCREEGVQLRRLADVTVKEALPFIQVAEIAVQMALSPDLEQTAVMAAADVICSDSSPDRSIFEHTPRVQAYHFRLAQSAINAYRQTLRLVPISSYHNEKYCQLMDAVAPKEASR